MSKTVLFQTIQFSIITVFFDAQLNVKIVLFQIIPFSIITQFSSIWFIDRTLSGATTPGQSGPGSKGNEEVLHFPHSSSIPGFGLDLSTIVGYLMPNPFLYM